MFESIGCEVFVTYKGRRMRYCVLPTNADALLFANAKNNDPHTDIRTYENTDDYEARRAAHVARILHAQLGTNGA